MQLRRKDIGIALLLGLLTALVWTPVLARLIKNHTAALAALFLIIPLIFLFGLYLGTWLSRWKPFFQPFSRYAMIGFFNSGIDFGVFNLLIYLTGAETGGFVVLFKSISFLCAIANSYFWNKYWAFGAGQTAEKGQELVSYLVVTIAGFVINVGIASLIVNFVPPQFGISQLGWDNLAAAIATVANLLWNYLGYHHVVFKQKPAA